MILSGAALTNSDGQGRAGHLVWVGVAASAVQSGFIAFIHSSCLVCPLADAQLKVLGEVGDVFLAKQVQLEIHSKKGDATDPRLLVCGSSSSCLYMCSFPVYWQMLGPLQ